MSDIPKTDLSKLKIAHKEVSVGQLSSLQWKWPAIIAALIICALFFVLLSGKDEGDEDTLQPARNTTRNANEREALALGLSASGYVVAERRASVSSKATGRLKELNVVEGDVVKAGQVLGVLENEDLQAQVRQAQANVSVLESRIAFAQAEKRDADRDFKRFSALNGSGGISQSELDRAASRREKADAELGSSRANYDLGVAQLEKAKVDLSYTYIMAPFDGTVLTKDADIGEIVAPFGSSANSRAAIVTIADMKSLEVEADVSEANLPKVFVGQKATIVLDSFPDKRYQGVVSKIVPTVDRAKATVLTKIKFLKLDDSVIPEMSAKITFHIPTTESSDR